MFRLILVPLDGTRFAERALPTAVMLARAGGGRLLLVRVHVLHPPTTEAEALTLPDAATLRAIEGDARDDLEAAARRVAAPAGVPADTVLVRGPAPHEAVHEVAVERGADLIVMASHERSALGRVFAGSVAERVAREPGVPVLIVHVSDAPREPDAPRDGPSEPPPPAADPPPVTPAAPFRRVLIPLDGSLTAEAVVEPAARLARTCGAAVTLLTVHDPLLGAAGIPEHAARPEHLQQVAERLRAEGLAVDVRETTDRDVARGITHAADEAGADVIAIGTHGRSGLTRLLSGSVAAGVLHGARAAVLVLHPADSVAFPIVPVGNPR